MKRKENIFYQPVRQVFLKEYHRSGRVVSSHILTSPHPFSDPNRSFTTQYTLSRGSKLMVQNIFEQEQWFLLFPSKFDLNCAISQKINCAFAPSAPLLTSPLINTYLFLDRSKDDKFFGDSCFSLFVLYQNFKQGPSI